MFITMFNMYQKNILPQAGGWFDQANKVIESIQIIEKTLLDKGKNNGR